VQLLAFGVEKNLFDERMAAGDFRSARIGSFIIARAGRSAPSVRKKVYILSD